MPEETTSNDAAVENKATEQENRDNEQAVTEEFGREQIEKSDSETAAQTTTAEPEAVIAAPEAETSETEAETKPAEPEVEEEISYHAVEKEGSVTAIWEMQGRRHLRTIDPRSVEGKHILSLFTSEHHEEAA